MTATLLDRISWRDLKPGDIVASVEDEDYGFLCIYNTSLEEVFFMVFRFKSYGKVEYWNSRVSLRVGSSFLDIMYKMATPEQLQMAIRRAFDAKLIEPFGIVPTGN